MRTCTSPRAATRTTSETLLADSDAIVTSDRWWAYNHLPLDRRQICWAHLRPRLPAHAEGLGAEKEFGEAGLRLCDELFWAWEVYQHTRERRELNADPRPARQFKPIVRQSRRQGPPLQVHCRGIARNLLKAWPALWTFAEHPGIEPTNNHAERALRSAVIYRKLSLGSQSTPANPHRPAALRAHHLPPPTPQPARLPRRRSAPTAAATQRPSSPSTTPPGPTD